MTTYRSGNGPTHPAMGAGTADASHPHGCSRKSSVFWTALMSFVGPVLLRGHGETLTGGTLDRDSTPAEIFTGTPRAGTHSTPTPRRAP